MSGLMARLSEDKRVSALCYLVACLLPIGVGLPSIVAVVLIVLLTLAALASKDSRLRFHAVQAMLVSLVIAMAIGILYLCIIYGVGINPKDGLVGALIYFGIWLSLVVGIVLGGLLVCGMLAFKTWRGKTPQLPVLGNWAEAARQNKYLALQGAIVILAIAAAVLLHSNYQQEVKPAYFPVIQQNKWADADGCFRGRKNCDT